MTKGYRIADKDRVNEAQFRAIGDQLRAQGRLAFRVPTGSMMPLIRPGDVIEVEPLRDPPRRFDILVFWNGEIFVCHYLMHVNFLPDPEGRDLYVTRALVSREADLPVPVDHVLGKVVSHEIAPWRRIRLVLSGIWSNFRLRH